MLGFDLFSPSTGCFKRAELSRCPLNGDVWGLQSLSPFHWELATTTFNKRSICKMHFTFPPNGDLCQMPIRLSILKNGDDLMTTIMSQTANMSTPQRKATTKQWPKNEAFSGGNSWEAQVSNFMEEFLLAQSQTFPRFGQAMRSSPKTYLKLCMPDPALKVSFPAVPLLASSFPEGANRTSANGILERFSVGEIGNQTIPEDSIPEDSISEDSISEDNFTDQLRRIAEMFWLSQKGRLYFQHSRKAGGTSLCMLLRLNLHGLMYESFSDWQNTKRKTCQLTYFCCDCDMTKKKTTRVEHYNNGQNLFRGFDTYPRLISCVLDLFGQNFIEFEGTESPPDILSNPEWANYVFVSTLRHPISRIISSLHNDPEFNDKNSFPKPRGVDTHKICPATSQDPHLLNFCAHEVLSSTENILSKCHDKIYHCYSNYYVRMFAGHTNRTSPVTNHTLHLAKRNFERYSCVILQECWDETAPCLSHRLGLHLNSQNAFNIMGGLRKNQTNSDVDLYYSDNTFLKSLTEEELKRLVQLNALDIEFYEWASNRILMNAQKKWKN